MSMKNPLTPAGIEPVTFRIVAQHLNHCATTDPMQSIVMIINEAQNIQDIEWTTFPHCHYVAVSILQCVKSQVNTYKYVTLIL